MQSFFDGVICPRQPESTKKKSVGARDLLCLRVEQSKNGKNFKMKEENERVIVDETFVIKFEDSTQPAKRIKLEPTDTDAKESKVFVDAITQTEALDNDPKVEIATQTDRPIYHGLQLIYPGRGGVRQQIIPRLALPNDEDDGVTCRMCLQPFWYKSELFEHLKTLHSISDPERYEKEEREKKLRRLREDQQRMAMAQRGRGSMVRHLDNFGLF